MKLRYQLKPVLIRRVTNMEHVGKKRNDVVSHHAHASYGHELIYLDYGRLQLKLDGKAFELEPGQIIFIHGGVTHTFSGISGVPFHYMNVMFRGTLPEDFFQTPIPVDKPSRKLIEMLRMEEVCQGAYFKEMIGVLLTELLIRLLRNRNLPADNPTKIQPVNRAHYESEIVEKAVSVISENHAGPLTLKQVGGAVGISESHLRALIRRETKKNFTALLHEIRIENAKRLIMEDSCTLTEIASKVGYQTPAFFFRIFKRMTGMTPLVYSRSLGDSLAEHNG